MTQDKVAIVTGASTGIGQATGEALVKAGWKVVFAARRTKLLEKIVAACGAANALAVSCDVRKPDSVKALFAKTKQRFGRLDLLFNNAGTGAPPVPIDELDRTSKWKDGRRREPDRHVPLRPGVPSASVQGPGPPGRPHHQQRLDLRPRPPAALRSPYTSTKHAVTGLTKSHRARRARARHLPAARSTSATPLTPMAASA